MIWKPISNDLTMDHCYKINGEKLMYEIGEALIGDGPELAHIDLIIGDKSGPVGTAFATNMASMSVGHTPLLSVVRPNLSATVIKLSFISFTHSGISLLLIALIIVISSWIIKIDECIIL